MRMSRFFCPTLKETPTEAETVSHKYMLRSGMIRKVAAGIYLFLPLGYRVMRKVERIVREEMEKAGAQEVHMPILQPGELWKESGRWEEYGPELAKLVDRRKREFCLGPTHEEVITNMIRNEIKSYKDLPINLFQIQIKVRDEIRPRFGVMRSREFCMKDAYSFHADAESLDETYQAMYRAYNAIFSRCQLAYRVVEADTGAIGGSHSHEFMVLAETGEDEILYCEECDYAANIEKAESKFDIEKEETNKTLKEVFTPGAKTIEDLTSFMEIGKERTIKTLLFQGRQGYVMALLRGNDFVNPAKLKSVLGEPLLAAVNEEEFDLLPLGFIGPVGCPDDIQVIADPLVMKMGWGVTGANRRDYHITGVKPGVDFKPTKVADIRLAHPGEGCLHCSGVLKKARGIEVGHIFKLGTKYSEPMGAFFQDTVGEEHPMLMGCYGIGIARTAAAAIEQNHDEHGIKWPWPLAPFHVAILTLAQNEELMQISETIHRKLEELGLEVLWDERKERPGVKFNDADLLGIPIRITLGRRFLKNGKVELKVRETGEELNLPVDELVAWITEYAQGKGHQM